MYISVERSFQSFFVGYDSTNSEGYSSSQRRTTAIRDDGRFHGNVREKFVFPGKRGGLPGPGIREKLSLNYEPLKEALRESFPTFHPSTARRLTLGLRFPLFSSTLLPFFFGGTAMHSGLQVENGETNFLKKMHDAKVMDTSGAPLPAFTVFSRYFVFYFNSKKKEKKVYRPREQKRRSTELPTTRVSIFVTANRSFGQRRTTRNGQLSIR